jgi:ligand-binding SRPBCC domain-containing protein
MKLYSLSREQILSGSPHEVFPFFERPENLSRITPPWLRFLIQTPSPVEMREGAVIDYTIRWMGIPLRWRTLVTAYRPPEEFVDEQIRGPYSVWRHTHRFETSEGGTRMLDDVLYAIPGGVAGRILHKALIRRQVEAIFDYRARAIAGLFAKNVREGS